MGTEKPLWFPSRCLYVTNLTETELLSTDVLKPEIQHGPIRKRGKGKVCKHGHNRSNRNA